MSHPCHRISISSMRWPTTSTEPGKPPIHTSLISPPLLNSYPNTYQHREMAYLPAIVRPQTSILDISYNLLPLWFANLNPSKVNLGLAGYGRGYTLLSPTCHTLNCPFTGPSLSGPCTNSPGILSLTEINSYIKNKNLTPELLEKEMIKQITRQNQWIGYDDAETFAMKRQWADGLCIGGTMTWTIDFEPGVESGDPTISPSKSGRCGSTPTGIYSCLNGAEASFGGPCCAANGTCGSDTNHCSVNLGCQAAYGNCTVVDPVARVSLGGSCGWGHGVGTICQGSAFGNCCSRHGWCGSTIAYCGVGCQSLFGNCSSS